MNNIYMVNDSAHTCRIINKQNDKSAKLGKCTVETIFEMDMVKYTCWKDMVAFECGISPFVEIQT